MEQKFLYLQVSEEGIFLFPENGNYEELEEIICELCGKCKNRENYRKFCCPIGWCG